MTDITLVSEDRKSFKAHKVILSACSPVFKSIINDGALSNPTVFLRGIHSNELSILQFIYLGKASFYQERMNEFLNVATCLEIKGIDQVKGIEIKLENQEFENSPIHTSNVETKQENHVDLSQRQTRSNLNNMSQNDS